MKKVWFMLAMMVCILASCSDGGSENPIEPTPKPEEVKTEIIIDSSIISNGLSFSAAEGEQSISFSVNANWTLSIASTTSGTTWCKASATSGSKGTSNVKFTISENTDYEDRSVSVTIKAGTVSKTFTITQKGVDALLVTTTKYEVAQEGGQIEIEVKANIDYKMEISEEAKDWIKESSGRALTTYKHKLDIAMNEDAEKREGEITFKSGDKVETVKVYQAGGAILLLSQNEYNVSDKGDTISVDIKSNIDFGVQMPDVDWIIDEASSRGMSSHTLKYIVSANEGYDSRSAEIVFYDKNSDLKDTLKVVQAQKDAIVISEKNISIAKEGGIVEVKVKTNVDFEVQIPSDATWISKTDSRALTEKSVYLKVDENTGEKSRYVTISFINKDIQVNETVIINQQGNVAVVTLKEAGTMKKLLGNDYLNITSLKVVGSINGDDIYYLRKMLGSSDFSKVDWGKLTTLDLSEATIVEGGEWYHEHPNSKPKPYYTSNNIVGDYMFYQCMNLQNIVLPLGVTSIGYGAFSYCSSLKSIDIPDTVSSIGNYSFDNCSSLTSVTMGDGILSIGKAAFSYCSSLTSVIMSDRIISIGEATFAGCSSLTSIVLPNGITAISSEIFSGCSSLTSIVLPNKITEIGSVAFYGCSALTSIILPDMVTSIGSGAFHGCSALTSVVLPDMITSIGSSAFKYCSSLTSINIPDMVFMIAYETFDGCSSLNDLYCYATTPPAISTYYGSPFPVYGEKTILHVPMRCVTKYKSSDWGKYFKTIKEME